MKGVEADFFGLHTYVVAVAAVAATAVVVAVVVAAAVAVVVEGSNSFVSNYWDLGEAYCNHNCSGSRSGSCRGNSERVVRVEAAPGDLHWVDLRDLRRVGVGTVSMGSWRGRPRSWRLPWPRRLLLAQKVDLHRVVLEDLVGLQHWDLVGCCQSCPSHRDRPDR